MQLTVACAFILVNHPRLLNSNRAQKTCPNQHCGAVWMHEIPQLSTSSPSQMNGELQFIKSFIVCSINISIKAKCRTGKSCSKASIKHFVLNEDNMTV